ncbi:universal stress protein, partial [Hydrogenophaga sp.]|uniref:universal stress protein n=1 Tax=Hydrogenophaga sp. TaxID=1904254 RepID=UPI003525C8F4
MATPARRTSSASCFNRRPAVTSQPERPPSPALASAPFSQPVLPGASNAAAMGLIVAITDLSVESEQALSRAVLLAVQHRAPLRFVYVAGGSSQLGPDPQARLMQRCRALGRQHNLPIEPIENLGAMLKGVKAAAMGANLLVVHHSLCGKLDGFFRRSTVDQLLHDSGCPVLVVKNPATEPYRSSLIALDLKAGSAQLLQRGLIAGSQTRVSVFHALDNQVMRAAATTPGQASARPSVDQRRTTERQRAQTYLRHVVDLHVPTGQLAESVFTIPVRGWENCGMRTKIYPSDIGKEQFNLIAPLLEQARRKTKPR